MNKQINQNKIDNISTAGIMIKARIMYDKTGMFKVKLFINIL